MNLDKLPNMKVVDLVMTVTAIVTIGGGVIFMLMGELIWAFILALGGYLIAGAVRLWLNYRFKRAYSWKA